jgi:hypothetical protein
MIIAAHTSLIYLVSGTPFSLVLRITFEERRGLLHHERHIFSQRELLEEERRRIGEE